MDEPRMNEDQGWCYFRIKLLYHPPSAQDPDPDRITFIAYIQSAMTLHQGLFGSAVNIDILHCQGMECWIRLFRGDKVRVWAALSSWKKDIEDGNRTLSWEVVKVAKSQSKISEDVEDFPNQPVSL